MQPTRGMTGREQRSVLWTGVILGIGLMGAIDTIVFHQLLQWHNFFYDTTEEWRIFSDGMFHAFTATLLFLGALRLWSQRAEASRVLSSVPLWAGVLLGAGGFQLFDGIVNHKILRLHQIREDASNQLPYDIGWNLFALAVLLTGWLLWRRHAEAPVTAERHEGRQPT